MTNPPDNPAGSSQNPNGPWGPPPPGQQPPQGPPPGGPYGPPPGWQPPPPNQPIWQGHQAPQQSAYGWQQQPPKKKRTGLVIGLVVGALLVIGGAVAAALLLVSGDDEPGVLAVSELEEGMCLASDDLASGNSEVDDMTEADCGGEHDAKVFAVLEVEDGESFDDAGSRCAEELGDDFDALRDEGIEVRPLATTDDPAKGDEVVCFLRSEDGEPLDQDVV